MQCRKGQGAGSEDVLCKEGVKGWATWGIGTNCDAASLSLIIKIVANTTSNSGNPSSKLGITKATKLTTAAAAAIPIAMNPAPRLLRQIRYAFDQRVSFDFRRTPTIMKLPIEANIIPKGNRNSVAANVVIKPVGSRSRRIGILN